MAARRLVQVASATAVLIVSAGCGEGTAAECVSSDVGKVCADAGDGAVNFRGEGLLPGSDVEVGETVVGPMTYLVGEDGSFDPGSSSGAMSVFSGTEWVFDVVATDADGDPLTGQIVIVSG